MILRAAFLIVCLVAMIIGKAPAWAEYLAWLVYGLSMVQYLERRR